MVHKALSFVRARPCVCLSLFCAAWGLTGNVAQADTLVINAIDAAPCVVSPPDTLELSANIECGTFSVAQNPEAPDGIKIKLPFARLSKDRDAEAAPLFMLAGGPGSSLLKEGVYTFFSDQMLGTLLETRDIIILEERGSQNSAPSLDCPAFHQLPWRAISEDVSATSTSEWIREAIETCRSDAEAAGLDLSHYNSLQIARDIDAARAAFGFQKIAVYGASYGTLLAQHYARMFSERVEALVLDGVETPETFSWAENRAVGVDFTIGHLAAQCDAQPTCADAFDLLSLIQGGIDLFDEGAVPASFTNPIDENETLQFDITVDNFVEFLFERQGGQIFVASLPAVLALLVPNGRDALAEGLGPVVGQAGLDARDATKGNIASLMHYAVVCAEDPVASMDDVKMTEDTSEYARRFAALVVQQYQIACDILDVPLLPDETDAPLASEVPTLILTGQLDARTPAFLADRVEQNLPNARQLVFPAGTHVQLGELNFCAAELMVSFLNNPSGDFADDCLRGLKPVNFALPDGALSQDEK